MVRGNPLVSIIVVTYNSQAYVTQALESILNNDYPNFEVIVCDDCSKDNTWKIIQNFKNPLIRAFQHKSNLGEYRNRNYGVQQAEGKYLVFIDGDDELLPGGISSAVRDMESAPNIAAFGVAKPVLKNEKRPRLVMPKEVFNEHYFGSSMLSMSFARDIYNTKILRAEGGINEHFISGDADLRLKLAAKYPIFLLREELGKWRKRSGQASEKLQGTLKGMLEPYLIKRVHLNSESCPLDRHERIRARLIIFRKQILHSLVLFRHGYIGKSLKMLIHAI